MWFMISTFVLFLRKPSIKGPTDLKRHRSSPSVSIKPIERETDGLAWIRRFWGFFSSLAVPRQKRETQSSSSRTVFPTIHGVSSRGERVTGSRPCWRPAASWRWPESCTRWVSAAALVWAGNAPSGSSGRSPTSHPSEAPTNKETLIWEIKLFCWILCGGLLRATD